MFFAQALRKGGNLKKKKNFFPSPFESPVIKVQAENLNAPFFPVSRVLRFVYIVLSFNLPYMTITQIFSQLQIQGYFQEFFAPAHLPLQFF